MENIEKTIIFSDGYSGNEKICLISIKTFFCSVNYRQVQKLMRWTNSTLYECFKDELKDLISKNSIEDKNFKIIMIKRESSINEVLNFMAAKSLSTSNIYDYFFFSKKTKEGRRLIKSRIFIPSNTIFRNDGFLPDYQRGCWFVPYISESKGFELLPLLSAEGIEYKLKEGSFVLAELRKP